MKVVYVTTSLERGGAEAQVAALATGFAGRGWDVTVVSMIAPTAHVDVLVEAGVTVDSLGMMPGRPDPRGVIRLARRLRRWKPDVVHSHMVHANILARVARPASSIPVLISTAHNIDEGGAWRERAYRLTDRWCDLTTNVSRAAVARYVEVGAAPAARIRWVPNGVDTERYKPDPEVRAKVRGALGIDDDRFLLLAVGRLDVQKDYPTMLRAMATAVGEGADAQLYIAGSGPDEAALRTMAGSLAAPIQFMGIRTDVPDLMNAADAYVMSSAWEGLPMVLLEASASGLPILATTVGGNPEVVADGVSGYLVPPGDPRALADGIVKMAAMPHDEVRAMGGRARSATIAEYGLPGVLDTWEAVYSEFLEIKRR